MKTREVYILREAEQDLHQGRAFYDRQGQAVGDHFAECILSDVGALRLYAGIHRQVAGLYRQLCHRFPFAVYYVFDDECVQV